MTEFELAPAFGETSAFLADLPLCQARLQLDARWPWIVLIPRRAGAREIGDLVPDDRFQLMEEIVLAGEAVRTMGLALGRSVEKLNVGALGNITPQLHVHIVGRRADDSAWPGPVWGVGRAMAYAPDALDAALSKACSTLGV